MLGPRARVRVAFKMKVRTMKFSIRMGVSARLTCLEKVILRVRGAVGVRLRPIG